MKQFIYCTFLAASFLFVGCSDDDNDMEVQYDYHAHILSPSDGDVVMMGNSLDIAVMFESHAGETVHNIQVQVMKEDGSSMLFDSEQQHVHETSGEYNYTVSIPLTMDEGFEMHKDYIVRATVWGHEDGEGETSEEVSFHVHMP